MAVTTRVAFSQSSWLVLGELGNRNIQGIYVPSDFIADGRDPAKHTTPFYADFWRDYVTNDELIEALTEFSLRNNTQYFPPSTTYCKDGEYGCLDHCQRTYACTLREQQAQHNECLVIVATQPSSTRYYWPALINNLDIPAYTCFVGRESLQDFVLDMHSQGKGVLFYMNYPDVFLARYPDRFERVSMPKGAAADQAKNTATFGENGYGNKTNNPVRVDRFDDTNQKLVSFNMFTESSNGLAISVFSRTRLLDATIEDILDRYTKLTNRSSSAPMSEDPYFNATCGWMRDNYKTWKGWMLMPLPLCTVQDHMTHDLAGCDNDSTVREVSFKWTVPDPTNLSNPYVCDGGDMTIPPLLHTSRSCDWLEENHETWYAWVDARPACDDSFYSYTDNDCGADSKREIEYYWLLPDSDNTSLSHECVGELPETIYIECEYMPVLSRSFIAIVVLVWILIAAVVVSMVLVLRYRNLPIIRRSQFEFLEAMLVGALSVCFAILIYAGQPNDALCAARPVVVSVGFTLVFGSLVIKTLRVYRIFNTKKLKRVVLPTQTMFKFLIGFLLIDTAILTTWFIVDFPSATKVPNVFETPTETDVIVNTTVCSSSSFIYSALLIFWKAILLGTGLYLSFQVRKVSSDFQESIYIFASSVVVAFACLLLLPLAYLVPLAATTFYVFFAIVLWLSTLSVVSLMLVPKVIRHRETASVGSKGSEISDESQMDNTCSRKSETTGPTLPDRGTKSPVSSKRGSRVAPVKDEKGKSVDAPLATPLPSPPPASLVQST